MLSDAKFLDSLLNFDKDNIPESVIEKIRKQYLTNPDFDPEKIKKVSAACEGLCRWVYAMSEYDKVSKAVAPKRKALGEAQGVYDNAMMTLHAKREQLYQVQVRLVQYILKKKRRNISYFVFSIGETTNIRRTLGTTKIGFSIHVRQSHRL